MKLTQEQQAIIESSGNIRINAVAGSGKTTTLIAYAKSRPAESSILYLAFNRSVKLEAVKKFAEAGVNNVKVETAHGLAFRHIVPRHQYQVKGTGYATHELVPLLQLQMRGDKHDAYIAANHINKFLTYFCNSDALKVQELNYIDTLSDPKAIGFVQQHYHYIEQQTRILLGMMDRGEIEITHDFYLKKFQLSMPVLPFDFILFDEGQDASPVILDVFFRQKAVKVIVGDTHQQIYRWRHAVNSLEKADYPTFHLSTSFRFGQEIADLAKGVLAFKEHIHKPTEVNIIGGGQGNAKQTHATLARTNLGLLLKAIAFVTEESRFKKIYFEGNIHSYTYAEEGTSLYDVLNLYNGKKHLIKDRLIQSMQDLDELSDYVEKTQEKQLGIMMEIVMEYGNEIPELLRTIKARHVHLDEKDKAHMVFSTVHKCKGMEYDVVTLVNDFMSEDRLVIAMQGKGEDKPDPERLNEEINLLYVAVTRAKHQITIPEALLPEGVEVSERVKIEQGETGMRKRDEKEGTERALRLRSETGREKKVKINKEKAYQVNEVREKYQAAYRPWTAALDEELRLLCGSGMGIPELAEYFGRSKGAIWSRIQKLELEII